jgi:hypothetical protein
MSPWAKVRTAAKRGVWLVTMLGRSWCRSVEPSSRPSVSEGIEWQLVLQVEADLGVGNKPNSILDRLLQGLVTAQHTESDTPSSERSDFLEAMLRSPSTSHTFEVVLSPAISDDALFKAIWKAYFQERIAKMAAHPVANFVFSAAVHRLDAEALEATLKVFLSEKVGKTLLGTWYSLLPSWSQPHLSRNGPHGSIASVDRPVSHPECGRRGSCSGWSALLRGAH